jgi:uncharacterized protein YciI
MRQQALWDEHARYMDALTAQGFVVLGGPLGDGAEVLLVAHADSEESLRARFATDPWTRTGLLEIARAEPWTILLDSRSP